MALHVYHVGVRGSYDFRVMEVHLSLFLSPLYLLRHALNMSVFQVNGAEADQCLSNLVWRSAIDTATHFPDLSSPKDLFYQLL